MAKDGGIPGYAEDCWKTSPVMDYIKKNTSRFNKDTRIYSDGNEAIYLFTGLPADLIPHRESKSDNANFIAEQHNEYYLIWFYDNASAELLSLLKLLIDYDYIQLASYPEGVIYYHSAPEDYATPHSLDH